jgi:hypothetical protein
VAACVAGAAVVLLVLVSCSPGTLLGGGRDSGSDGGPGADRGPADSPQAAEDDAVVVSMSLPTRLSCGQSVTASVVMRNTGRSTWTRDGGYRLAVVSDRDALAQMVFIELPAGDAFAPGSTHAFEVPLRAPDSPAGTTGDTVTAWQMARGAGASPVPFGEAARQTVVLDCAVPPSDAGVPPADLPVADGPPPADMTAAGPDGPPVIPPGVPTDVDLAQGVTILNSPPDTASWPITATITTLDLGANGVYINFTRRDGTGSWPDVPFGMPGDSLEYTLWIILNVNGQLYTSGCIQYWRGLDRNGGPPSGYAMNWYYDANRWAPMTGHQPVVGEMVGFFVTAGNARNVTDDSGSTVYERSNIVVVPFPDDTGAVFNY